MKKFNKLEEMRKYFNDKTNTYEFVEKGGPLNVEINFNISVKSNIRAGNIDARNISAYNITASRIDACNITAGNIDACDITAWDIVANDIDAWNITATNITTRNIDARNIEGTVIEALNIIFYSVCFAEYDIVCKSIKGRRTHAKYFSLDGNVIITK